MQSVQYSLIPLRFSMFLAIWGVVFPGVAQGPVPDQKHLDEIKKDVEQGKEYVKELEKDLKISGDATLLDRVKRIGEPLAAIANKSAIPATYGDSRLSPFEYSFKVVIDKDVNAFSVPGGFIYVHTGLLENVESDAELAGVLAHEIAHASHRHLATLAREYSKASTLTTIAALLVAVFADGRDAVNAMNAQQLFLMALTSGWSERAELDADQAGLKYLLQTGHNPVGLLTFMERLAFKENRLGPKIDWGIQRTHPPSRKRVEELRKLLVANKIAIARSEVTTSFRVAVSDDGERKALTFGEFSLFTVGGADAAARAVDLAEKMNRFFDSTPQIFAVRADDNRLMWFGRPLVEFREGDIAGKSGAEAAKAALAAVKNALFSLDFRTGG
jgi:Zn-dependent protease with chaperone function